MRAEKRRGPLVGYWGKPMNGRLTGVTTAIAALVTGAALGIAGARTASAADPACNDATSPVTHNISGSIDVEEGTQCHLNGFTIGGSVYVEDGAKLFARNGTVVHGSISATNPQQLNIEKSTHIYGSLSVNGTPAGGFGGFLCGSIVGGSVSLTNLTSGRWVIGEPSDPNQEGGTYEGYDYNGGGNYDQDLTCESPNWIGGSVTFTGSDDVNGLELAFNTIKGSVSITNNDVVDEAIEVESNSIGSALACSGNDWDTGSTPVTNGGQTNWAKTKTGQCSGL
jgi:hypothetical protein